VSVGFPPNPAKNNPIETIYKLYATNKMNNPIVQNAQESYKVIFLP